MEPLPINEDLENWRGNQQEAVKKALINILGEIITHNNISFFIESTNFIDESQSDKYLEYAFNAHCKVVGMPRNYWIATGNNGIHTVTCSNCHTDAPADFMQHDNEKGGYVCHVCLQNYMYSSNIQPILKNFRNTYNLTQKEAAKILGYGYDAWVSYENGRRDIPPHLLKHIELYNKYKEIS